jgi:hypothetical protein
MKKIPLFLIVILLFATLTACGSPSSETTPGETTSSDVSAEYASQTITIVTDPEHPDESGSGNLSITVAELRDLPQHEASADFFRTTGLEEKFEMKGPLLTDVFDYLGLDISEYEGIGISGIDGYYCLFDREAMASAPELMLAIEIDGVSELETGLAPARVGAQGLHGPYWVKMVNEISLYKEIPEKDISSVWVFKNLASGIEPFQYEYYGETNDAIDLALIWSRLDHVDLSAFFTMKSSDGFTKNEVMSNVVDNYYIMIEGEYAPMNMAPNIELGMNVQYIAWCSSSDDAMIFPEELIKYMDTVDIGGRTGIPLSEILYETGVQQLGGYTFSVIGTDGQSVTVSGDDLSSGILCINGDGTYSVVWDDALDLEPIDNLLRVRRDSTGE